MRKSRFTEAQIVAVLQKGEAGLPVVELLRKHAISRQTYFTWKNRYGGKCAGAATPESPRAGQRPAQAHVCRVGPGARGHSGRAHPKTVGPSARRAVAAILVDDHCLAIGRACAIAGCSRTAWYRPPADRSHRDQPVIEALLVLADTRDRWGFWKYATLLHAAHGWNPKRVYRVYCALKLNLPRRRKKRVLARPPWRWKPRRC